MMEDLQNGNRKQDQLGSICGKYSCQFLCRQQNRKDDY